MMNLNEKLRRGLRQSAKKIFVEDMRRNVNAPVGRQHIPNYLRFVGIAPEVFVVNRYCDFKAYRITSCNERLIIRP